MVTIELQYANKINSVPSQSFVLLWLHNRLKQGQKHGYPSSVRVGRAKDCLCKWAGAVTLRPLVHTKQVEKRNSRKSVRWFVGHIVKLVLVFLDF